MSDVAGRPWVKIKLFEACKIEFLMMVQLQPTLTCWCVLHVVVLHASRLGGIQLGQQSSQERGAMPQGNSDTNAILPPPTLEEWMDTLALPQAQARADAALALGNLGKKAAMAIPKLTQLLQDEGEVADGMFVRDAAVKALGDMGSEAASSVVQIFEELQRKSTSRFRENAAYALGRIGQEVPAAVLPGVKERLQRSSWAKRWVAAKTCGLLGEKAAALVPQLRQVAKYDSDSYVRKAASESLSAMSKVMTLPAVTLAEWQAFLDSDSAQARADAALALGNLGKEAAMAIPKLTELLQYDDEVADGVFVRDAAVKALGDMGSEAASSVVQIFEELQRKSTNRFPENAAYALGHIGQEAPEAVLPGVKERLQGSSSSRRWWFWGHTVYFDATTRWVAAKTCGLLGEKAAALVPQLRQVAKYDSDSYVRKAASESLSAMSKVMTLPAVTLAEWQAFLDSNSAQARADAALALGNLGKEAAMAIPKLTELLQYDDEVADGVFVRDAAVKALGDMGSEAASSVVQIFEELQRKSTSRFRENAAYALGHIGQEVPAAVLPGVKERLQRSSWANRWVAAKTCGLLGEKAAALVPQLRQVAKYDSDSYVRKAASESLSAMSKVMTLPAVTLAEWQAFLDSDSAQARADAALALGSLGKEAAMAIPKLTELLQYDDEVADGVFVRDAAVKALGDMGSEAASSVVQIFEELQRKSTSRFRENAAYALGHIGQEVPAAVLPGVKERLQRSSWANRWVAAKTCGWLGDKAAALVPQLRQVAKYDSDSYVRKAASESLSAMSKVMTLPAVTLAEWQAFLDSDSAQARADAALALGNLGKEAAMAIPKLTELLQYDDEVADGMFVRDAAVKALGDMGSEAASSVVQIFEELQRKSTSRFRENAAYALGHIGQEVPAAVLPGVKERLQRSSWANRWVAAKTCGLLGEKAAALVPQLRQVAKYDSDSDVRTTAQAALDLIDKATDAAASPNL